MENKLTKEKVLRISKITLSVLFYVVILLLLLFAIANMKVKTTGDIPNVFGRGFLSVQSNSMDGSEEDSFKQGDLLIVNMLNDKEREELKVGDIVTFYGSFYNEQTKRRDNFVNTHRIVNVLYNAENQKVLVTQGDWVADQSGRKYVPGGENDDENYESILASEAIAVHKSTWSGAGNTLDFLQSPLGFGLFIVLPAVIILIVEAYFLIRNVLRVNKEKMEKEFKEKDEAMREQIKAELLKEQELANSEQDK